MTVENLGSLFAEISKLNFRALLLASLPTTTVKQQATVLHCILFLHCPNTGTFSWSAQLGVFTSVLFLLPALSEITVL